MRILCVRDLANGDHIIVSTALTSAQTERKLVVIVGTDTDLLVILIPNPLQIFAFVSRW